MTNERGRPPHPELLTPAEQRVLEEVRAGHQNAEIASRLGISVNTVRYHVSNMLGKLELPNRTALRAWDGEGSRRRWGWLGVAGRCGGRGTSGVGALVASVTVGVVAAGLLVVGSGRMTLPSGVVAEPSAVVSSVGVEPQDVAASGDASAGRVTVARIYGRDGSEIARCVAVSYTTVGALAISQLTPTDIAVGSSSSASTEPGRVADRHPPMDLSCLPPLAMTGPPPG